MHNRSILIHILILLAVVQGFSSCIMESGICQGERESIEIKFTLAMTSPEPQTRAGGGTWGDDDYEKESASRWENAIEYGRLQVLVYDLNNAYIGQLSDISYSRRSDEDNIYDIIGNLSLGETFLQEGKLSCKLVVFANFDAAIPEQAEGSPLSNIKNSEYSYDYPGISGRTSYIPMWGVQSYSDDNTEAAYKSLPVERGRRSDAGEIFLLRSLGKLRVSLSNTLWDEGYRLSTVNISDYNKTGYIVPSGYTSSSTKTLFYSGDVSPLSFNAKSSKMGTGLPFEEEIEGKSFIIYLPEHLTSATSSGTDPFISLSVTSEGDAQNTRSYTIWLKQYSGGSPTGDPLSLTRNTVYDYTISALSELKVDYSVMPWTDGGNNSLEYKFRSTLSTDSYKIKTLPSSSEKAVAVTYGEGNTGASPYLTLEVETSFEWRIHTDNPDFGFLVAGSSTLRDNITTNGSGTVKFKLVPKEAIDFTETNRSYRAAVFVTIPSSSSGIAGKVPFNSGSNALPNGDEKEVLFYQVTSTEYSTLSSN